MSGSDPVFGKFGTGVQLMKCWNKKGMQSQCRGMCGPVLELKQRKSLEGEEGELDREKERGVGGDRERMNE